MKLTKNFSLSEFECADGTEMTCRQKMNVQELALYLQVLRDYINEPIYINSGHRSPDYNEQVGGADNSQHLKARASDIWTHGLTSTELKSAILELIADKRMKQGGVGLYDSFVHYDTRGYKARWNG